MDSQTLSILIKATDLASADIEAVRAQLAGLGDTADETAAKTDAAADSTNKNSSSMTKLGAAAALGAVGVGVLAGVTTKMAGDFQESMTQLVTGAGESEKNLAMVSQGVLNIADATGTSTQSLSQGLYLIESAGYHGASGLNVLKAAAEGAKVGNADLQTVADALTSTLNAYHLSAGQSVQVTNEMVATVAAGKMHMQDLASSISNVLPVAAAAGISFAQVGGAIATMTGQGMSADQATQDLANTIRSLQNPNSTAVAEMEQLGLSATNVEQNLGKKGLTGTLQELTQAITSQMGPSGTVIMDAFNKSQDAAKDLNTMISQMPAPVAALAKQFESGAINMSTFRKEIPTNDMGMINQFTSLYGTVNGFNSLIKSGGPAAQTYTAALSKMMGGATGLNTALLLTGGNMATFQNNVNTVADASKKGGADVSGWSLVQKDFNQQMSEAKESVQTTGIAIGTALLPAVTTLLGMVKAVIMPIAEFAAAHKTAAAAIFLFVGGALVFMAAMVGIVKGVKDVKAAFTDVGTALSKGWDFAKSTAGFVQMAAKAVWSAAQSAASWIASAATTVAANVAAAATSMAAWLAANAVMIAGILGIVIVVALVVALIVTHWKQISKAAVEVWDAIVAGAKFAFGIIATVIKAYIDIYIDVFKVLWAIVSYIFDVIRALAIIAFQAIYNVAVKPVMALIGLEFRALQVIASVVWGAISTAAQVAWSFIYNTVVHPIAQAINNDLNVISGVSRVVWSAVSSVAQSTWNGIVSFARGAWSGVTGLWNGAIGFFNSVFGAVGKAANGVGGAIAGAFSGAFNAIVGAGKSVINGFITLVDNVIGTVNGSVGKLPGVPKIPTIPHLASGTSFFQGGLALVGEQGPELIGLPTGASVTNAGATANAMSNGGSGSNMSVGVTVNVGIYAGQPGELNSIATTIWQAIQRVARQHGMAGNVPNIGIVPQ